MTLQALLAIALSCPTLAPSLAPIMAGIAAHENPKLDPRAVNHNANGTRDMGIAQVNEINFGWTGLKDPFDPCQNLTAAAKVLFAKYNGNPPDTMKALYAAGVMARLAQQAPTEPTALAVPAAEVARLEDNPGEPETLTGEN
jgi:soluble lytic murein transglycosylase-like protein